MDETLKAILPEGTEEELEGKGILAQLKILVAALTALISELRGRLSKQDEVLKEKDAEIKELRAQIFGPSSERKPREERQPVEKRELTEEEEFEKHLKTVAKRKARREKSLKELPVEREVHVAPETCPSCGSSGPFVTLSSDLSSQIELVTAHIKRIVHLVEKRYCTQCGEFFTGDAPDRVGECAIYGPQMHAHVVVSKCADAMPINRLSKRFARAGVLLSRSTLTDMFHRTAGQLEPIYKRLLEGIKDGEYVNADETSQPVMDKDKCRRGFMWTFISGKMIGYIFSPTRSGKTPLNFLGGTKGRIQVDGYSGYNSISTPEGRGRDGCLSHVRRYHHKAREYAPDVAAHSISVIRQIYEVDYVAAKKGILGTEAHGKMRKRACGPIMKTWKKFLEKEKPKHTPKSPPGRAIRYTLKQWDTLTTFMDDPKIKLDNNISERALRVIALGRDSFRWVGNDKAGKNLAILQTIVATCVANDVNPEVYISDVLMRVATHPASDIDALLPANWQPA